MSQNSNSSKKNIEDDNKVVTQKTGLAEPSGQKGDVDMGQGWINDVPVNISSKPVYLREKAEPFQLPSYKGERYEAFVPDTYDISERAGAVQNVLSKAVDPDFDYQMYFRVEFARNPAIMKHGGDDICQTKYMQALPLIRLITGDESNMEVDRAWFEAALKQLGPDGLNYLPLYPYNAGFINQYLDNKSAGHFCFTAVTYTAPFAVQYSLSPEKVWRDALIGLINGINSVIIDRGDWAYIPMRFFTPGQPRPKDAEVPGGAEAVHLAGFPMQGIGITFRLTGYEPAGILAKKLSCYIMDKAQIFDAEGRFLKDNPKAEPHGSHFHSHTMCLLNMLEYALPAGDERLLDFINKSFSWARFQGEHTIKTGNWDQLKENDPNYIPSSENLRVPESTLGYFPELIFSNMHEEAEACEIADMIGIGLKLSAAGIGDYWDDVERWIRNQFAENQLMDTAWVHQYSSGFPVSKPVEPGATDCDVIERNRGAFAGWAMANAWMNHEMHSRTQIMHCCTGNGARAIYYIWEHILHYDQGKLKLNLLLNRASKWVDVNSHIPYCGKVDIIVKEPVDLWVRIPGWTDIKKVRCTLSGRDPVNGKSVEFDTGRCAFAGRYVNIGHVKPGETVLISFPIGEAAKLLEIEKRRYSVIMRGPEAVNIDPAGKLGQFYQRSRYRGGVTHWKKAERFVPDRTIIW